MLNEIITGLLVVAVLLAGFRLDRLSREIKELKAKLEEKE